MNRTKSIIVIAGITISLLMLFLFVPPLWKIESATLETFGVGQANRKEDALVRSNRVTGTAYRYSGGSWQIIKEPKGVGSPLDFDVKYKITARAGFQGYGQFSVSVYNGSNCRITGVKINLNVECSEKDSSFVREYYEKSDIAPFSEGEIIFKISKPSYYVKHDWSIVTVYGVPEMND